MSPIIVHNSTIFWSKLAAAILQDMRKMSSDYWYRMSQNLHEQSRRKASCRAVSRKWNKSDKSKLTICLTHKPSIDLLFAQLCSCLSPNILDILSFVVITDLKVSLRFLAIFQRPSHFWSHGSKAKLPNIMHFFHVNARGRPSAIPLRIYLRIRFRIRFYI